MSVEHISDELSRMVDELERIISYREDDEGLSLLRSSLASLINI